jgi:putative phosphoesterase
MGDARCAMAQCDYMQMMAGLISDTHGLVRPEVFEALAGADIILHAGDVGGQDVLVELRAIAPVYAVYGNTDLAGEPGLSGEITLHREGLTIHVSHGHELGRPTPERLLERYEADVIVYGHTHRPLIERSGTRLVVNPGAAGPRRFNLKPSVACMTLGNGRADVRLVWLWKEAH